jgi:hypothetical protein
LYRTFCIYCCSASLHNKFLLSSIVMMIYHMVWIKHILMLPDWIPLAFSTLRTTIHFSGICGQSWACSDLRGTKKELKKFAWWTLYLYTSPMTTPLWSSGQSSWLQIQLFGFGLDSWRFQIFWEVVCLEWGPLSLASIIEELLGWKISGCSLESREYCRREPSLWPCGPPSICKSWH